MKARLLGLAIACLSIGGFSFSLVQAQQRGGAPAGPPRLGFRVAPATYQQNCGTCHGTTGTVTEGKKAPSIGELQELAPERVYSVIHGSTIPAHANLATFNELQNRHFAEFTSRRPLNRPPGHSNTLPNHSP